VEPVEGDEDAAANNDEDIDVNEQPQDDDTARLNHM